MTTTHDSATTHDSHTHSHDGLAPHSHGGGPGTGTEPGLLAPSAGSASVMLDIGDGYGALVILPGERFRGTEIEISPVDGDDEPRTHTGVHERSNAQGSSLTAIFGSLAAGEYVIWEDPVTPGPVVEVPDGAVAQIHLP